MADDQNIVEEPITAYGQLDESKTYTYIDYLKWKFDERVELIRGRILKMAPAPSRKHQVTLRNLNRHFDKFYLEKSCEYFFAPFDVRLSVVNSKKHDTVVQPDLCVVCDESKLDDAGCNGSPDLIVEILSPSNTKHDLKTKFDLYEEVGVQEYWIVNPWDKTVLVYHLQNKVYIGSKFYTEGESVSSVIFSDLKVSVDDIFEKVN